MPVDDGADPYWAISYVAIKTIQIAHAVLGLGFLVRGGIEFGGLWVDPSKGQVIGPALVTAVELEKVAKNPMIILGDEAKSIVLGSFHSNKDRSFAIFSRNSKNRIFINSVYPYKDYVPSYALKQDGSSHVDLPGLFLKYKGIIESNISEDQEVEVKKKWQWFANLYNATITEFRIPCDPIILSENNGEQIELNFGNKPPFVNIDGPWVMQPKQVVFTKP